MIAYIEGKIRHKEPTQVILDVGGLGYQLRISLNTYGFLKDKEGVCLLHTYLQIKEDAHTLYGFSDLEEKQLFLQLLSVSGIGGNTALMILSSLNTREVIRAIASEDVRLIQSIKGIGAKTAQRLILELKDKVQKEHPDTAFTEPAFRQARQSKEEALLALTALGIAKNTAEKNLETILRQQGDKNPTTEELIKLALKM